MSYLILYQVKYPMYSHKCAKGLYEQGLVTECATRFPCNEAGLDAAYKAVIPGYAAYIWSIHEMPKPYLLLILCHDAIRENRAKFIAGPNDTKPKKSTFDWGRRITSLPPQRIGHA